MKFKLVLLFFKVSMIVARPMELGGEGARAPACSKVSGRAEDCQNVAYPPMELPKDLKDAKTNTFAESSCHAEDNRDGFGLRHRQGPTKPKGHYPDPEDVAPDSNTNQGNPTNLAVPGKTRKRERLSHFFRKFRKIFPTSKRKEDAAKKVKDEKSKVAKKTSRFFEERTTTNNQRSGDTFVIVEGDGAGSPHHSRKSSSSDSDNSDNCFQGCMGGLCAASEEPPSPKFRNDDSDSGLCSCLGGCLGCFCEAFCSDPCGNFSD